MRAIPGFLLHVFWFVAIVSARAKLLLQIRQNPKTLLSVFASLEVGLGVVYTSDSGMTIVGLGIVGHPINDFALFVTWMLRVT